ncbi:CUB domain-containing protein [Bdellovibrio bacteriovorus]|uniref:CUB domain-containing protein n=1 Tax=Bdellovibrio bacteriovorus TaxID=959 RepID=UPI0035A67BE7
MNCQARLRKIGVFLSLILALSGCNLSAQIQDLLEAESQGPIQLKISEKNPYLIVNAANVAAKSISGTCTNNDGSVQITLNTDALASAACNNNQWSILHDFSPTPDSDNLTLTVQETTVNGELLTDTAVLLKDTLPPQLTPLSSQLIPALPQTASWSCLDPLDLCQFRVQESDSPAFVFVAEDFNSTASASLSTPGIRYLYIQATDKAQNLSAPVQVQLYVGQPKIFIGALSKELTLNGIEDLNILAPASLPEMALFNNETCSGTKNWISTENFVPNWALDPTAEGGTAYVSVKFRTATMQESACYHDSIQWPIYTSHTMCTSTSSSLSRGRIVDSGGTSGPYQNNENCALNLTLAGPTNFTFDLFDTEEGYDFIKIYDGETKILDHSGTELPDSFTTTSNNVRVEFISDVSYTQAGFNLRWESAGTGATQTISLNNGDAIAVKNLVDVALSTPSPMFQTYLTEDPSCSSGGTWTAFTAATTWTFATASSGPKELFVKFRDAFNQETFCSSASIRLELPEISIDYPATEDQIGNSLVIGGYCSIPNKQVQLSGTLTGSTTCAPDQSWELTLDTSALANNSAVNVTATLKDGSETLASNAKTYTITRTLSLQTPAPATTIGPTTQFGGSCNISGATINITSPVTTTTTCTAGSWSASINVPGADGATITLTAQLLHNSIVQETKSATYTLSTTPPTVQITGAPSGVSVLSSVNVNFGGTNVGSVRYKIGNSTDCSSSTGYSTETAAPATRTLDISGLSNGNVTLCAVGKNPVNGLWQDFASASSVSWTKDSEVVATITSKNISVDEGTTNNTITFALSGTKTYDVKIYFDYFGRQIYMADHNLAPGFVTIPAGTLTASVSYDTFDNGLNDSDRDLRIYISHTDQPAVRIGATSLVSHLIKDNDAVFKTVLKVVAARNNQCAIYSDNRLFCWGDNYYGQLGLGHKNRVGTIVEPLPGTTFIDVSITTQSICAITSAKKLKCWGYNYYGDLGIGSTTDQTSPADVDSAENYVQVSLGANGACALTELGKVKCWGRNVSGTNGDGTTANSSTPQLIDSSVTYTSVHRKSGTACGITAAQELKCWGGNSYQQIVVGSTSNVLTPTVVDAGTTYLSATGGSTVCGITTANKLKCWGWNNNSNVGAYAGTNPVVTRATIDGATNYLFISDDMGYRCAITSNNDLKCWGEVRGTVNSNQTTLLTSPTDVNDGIKYSQIAMAGYGACGVSTDGQIVCMGDHYNNWFEPAILFDLTLVDTDTTVSDYGVGSAGACAIKSDGLALCLGAHAGAGSTVSTPAIVDNGSNFTGGKAVPSNNGSCVINGSGQMFCSGANGFGAVGNGATESYVPYMSPVAHSIAFANTARETFYCGYGISTSGTFYAWGSESSCPSRTPAAVDTGTTYKPETLAVADSLACAITTGDQLKCFGYDGGTGHLGGVSRNTPTLMDSGTQYRFVSVAYALICGITTADKVKCWGANSTGKVGNGTTTNTSVPYTVDSTETFTKLSVGSSPVCAITSGQVLKCWGYWGDYTGNLTVTSPTVVNAGTSYLDIKVGSSSALAMTTDGKLHYWPTARFDQAPIAIQPATTFTSIKGHGAGYTYCAMDTSSKLWCSKARWDGTFVSTPRYMPYRRQ